MFLDNIQLKIMKKIRERVMIYTNLKVFVLTTKNFFRKSNAYNTKNFVDLLKDIQKSTYNMNEKIDIIDYSLMSIVFVMIFINTKIHNWRFDDKKKIIWTTSKNFQMKMKTIKQIM